MTFLWILLAILYVACWIYWAVNLPQGALLAVLDRILLPDPVDHWRSDQSDSTRCRHRIDAIASTQCGRLGAAGPVLSTRARSRPGV